MTNNSLQTGKGKTNWENGEKVVCYTESVGLSVKQ